MNGLEALDTIRDVNLVAIPGIGDVTVVAAGTNYCTLRGDCFFIGDMNPHDDTLGRSASPSSNSLHGQELLRRRLLSVAADDRPDRRFADAHPGAALGVSWPGMYARIDATRGVFKAPAGTEANLGGRGRAGDATPPTPSRTSSIRSASTSSGQFPASGIVIWGARTLATQTNPEYRYIPVRRTAIFLEQSIYNGIQFAVFEPNDFPLWASLRLNITRS